MELQGIISGISFDMMVFFGEEGWYVIEVGIVGSGFGWCMEVRLYIFFVCQIEIDIIFNFDFRLQEMSWEIWDDFGNVVVVGGLYFE